MALFLVVATAGASADTFVPTRHDDPTPGKCKPKDCSLREAVIAANADPSKSVVKLGGGTYKIQIPVPAPSDTGSKTGDINPVSTMTIQGHGPRKTKIDGGGLDRVFTFVGFGGDKLKLIGVTVMNGDPTGGYHPVNSGGGILVDADHMLLKNVVLRHNSATFGGGMRVVSEDMKIKNSTIDHNVASEGGGIDFRSDLNAAHTLITSSTISHNQATKGGGFLADGLPASPSQVKPDVNLVTSTVAENRATGDGGGIMADNAAHVTLGGSTVAYNLADSDLGGGGVAGGIYEHSGAVFVFADSILAQNETGPSGSDPECSGSFTSNLGAVVEVQSAPCAMSGSPMLVGSAKTRPLADNGGPTKTVKIVAGSPAIGSSVECAKRDQRGVKRPATGCDSGAYERKAP